MKKVRIMLLMLVMIFSMTACGNSTETSENISDDTGETVTDVPETEPAEADIPETESIEIEEFVKMYELSNIEFVKGNGETQQTDFIPGSEIYIFTEGEDYLKYEYKYKKYPTEEDMLNDSNYSIESVYGTYTLNVDKTQLTLLGKDGRIKQAEVSGDKIIFEYSQEGYDVKMVTTYTETEEDKLSKE